MRQRARRILGFKRLFSELLWSPDDRLCRIRLADSRPETWFDYGPRAGKNYRKDEHFPNVESGVAS